MLLWFIGRIGRGQIKRSQTTDWSENAKSSVELAENRDLQFRSRNAHLGTGLQDVPGLRLSWEVVGEHPLYHRGGIACVLASAVEKRRCLRHCRRGAGPSHGPNPTQWKNPNPFLAKPKPTWVGPPPPKPDPKRQPTVAFTTSSLRFHPIILICLVA